MLKHDATTPSPQILIHGIFGTRGAAFYDPPPPSLSSVIIRRQNIEKTSFMLIRLLISVALLITGFAAKAGGLPASGTALPEKEACCQRYVTIMNPYRNVEWDRCSQYKGNFHALTRLHKLEKDGRIILYEDSGYEESGGEVYGNYHESYGDNTTYPWTLWGRDPEKLGMVAVEGKELTNPHRGYHEHDVSLFNNLGETDQHKGGYNRTEILDKVSRRMGLLSLAHPRGNMTSGELAGQVRSYNAGVLMEVFTRGSSTDTRDLWDDVLEQTMPFDPIWGLSVDDMYSFYQLGTKLQHSSP